MPQFIIIEYKASYVYPFGCLFHESENVQPYRWLFKLFVYTLALASGLKINYVVTLFLDN